MARVKGAYCTTTKAPGLQRAWQAMRVLRRFTTADVIMTAEVGESACRKYLRGLALTGFVALERERVSGRAGSRDVWRLVRDTGPKAPIRRWDGTGVYDPNTGDAWVFDGGQEDEIELQGTATSATDTGRAAETFDAAVHPDSLAPTTT